jgi:hypothetical protein
MNKIEFTDKEIQDWIDKTDPDLMIDAYDCFIDPDDIDFSRLYKKYNELSMEKYGYKLNIKLL